jgi:hypothetical protein
MQKETILYICVIKKNIYFEQKKKLPTKSKFRELCGNFKILVIF